MVNLINQNLPEGKRMLDKVLKILNNICESDELILSDTELLESGILDSLAMIELFNELEDIGIEIQPTKIKREQLKTAKSIAKLPEMNYSLDNI